MKKSKACVKMWRVSKRDNISAQTVKVLGQLVAQQTGVKEKLQKHSSYLQCFNKYMRTENNTHTYIHTYIHTKTHIVTMDALTNTQTMQFTDILEVVNNYFGINI